MENRVFREKSLERIKSPDDMHEYLHISSPRLWMVLSIILAFLIGFIVYAGIARIENVVSGQAEVYTFSDLEKPICTITMQLPTGMDDMIEVGMEFRIEGQEGTVISVAAQNEYAYVVAELNDPDVLLKTGTYDAEIVLERVSPLSFLIN